MPQDLLVSLVLHPDLAAEEPVDEDEVHAGEHHPDAPPDEAEHQAVRRSRGVVDREAILRVYGGQGAGGDGGGGAGHHAEDVDARGEKSRPVLPFEVEVACSGKAAEGQYRQYDTPRAFGEVGEHLGTQVVEGRHGSERREEYGRDPAEACDAPGPGVEVVLGLYGYEVGAVDNEGRE